MLAKVWELLFCSDDSLDFVKKRFVCYDKFYLIRTRVPIDTDENSCFSCPEQEIETATYYELFVDRIIFILFNAEY